MKIGDIVNSALDILLPRSCLACELPMHASQQGMVCSLCWSRVRPLPEPRCFRCGHPLAGEECSWCKLLPPYVRAARSYCWFPAPVASEIVGALKYDGWHNIAHEIADRMTRHDFPPDVRAEVPILVPVPLSQSRERERGYNQSCLLALALGRRWELPVMVNCLRRSRNTVTQTRLTPDERSRNVSGAFTIANGSVSSLHGRHVLLVDDVVTTSATLNECAASLFHGGARIISYITFGRARAAGDST